MNAELRRPYGVGFAYRPDLHRQVMAHAGEIDLLEIPTEDYIIRRRRILADAQGDLLRQALGRFPAVAHGIHMSLGSVEPHDQAALDCTLQLLREHDLTVFSEHLAYHRLGDTDLMMFQCLPFEETTAQWVAAKYDQVRSRLARPMGLENVSYYSSVPHSPWTEAEFLTRVTELTDCTLLLDVTNVFNNAANHGYDAVDFIRRLPGDRVEQLHLAGGHYAEGLWQDSHSRPVMPPVWDLLHHVLECTAAEYIILERDSNFEPFEIILEDIRQARQIFYQHRSRKAPAEGGRVAARPPEPAAIAPEAGDGRLHPLVFDPEVQQLRAFQSATVATVSDPVLRRRWAEAPGAVAAYFGLDERWTQRWLACDRPRLELLQRKWDKIEPDQRQRRELFARYEWSAWAQQASAAPDAS